MHSLVGASCHYIVRLMIKCCINEEYNVKTSASTVCNHDDLQSECENSNDEDLSSDSLKA